MRIPRDLSGADWVKRLERFGYSITRQTGSHLRLISSARGERHLTISITIRCASAPWQPFSTASRRIMA